MSSSLSDAIARHNSAVNSQPTSESRMCQSSYQPHNLSFSVDKENIGNRSSAFTSASSVRSPLLNTTQRESNTDAFVDGLIEKMQNGMEVGPT